MPPDYTTVGLLTSIRRRAGAPNATSQGTTDYDLLAMANDELNGEVLSLLKQVNDGHLVTTYETPLVGGQGSYALPPRALGAAIRDATIRKVDGRIQNLRELDYADLPRVATMSGEPVYFYFKDTEIVVHPTPLTTSGDVLQLPYYRACSKLVMPQDCDVVASIAGNVVTVVGNSGVLPAGFNTAATYDFVKAKPPFSILSMDRKITGISGLQITFDATTPPPSTLAVGDYLCLSEESPIPQIPRELFPFLAQATAVELLNGPFGDIEQLGSALGKLQRMRMEILPVLLSPRNQGEQYPLANPYFFGGFDG